MQLFFFFERQRKIIFGWIFVCWAFWNFFKIPQCISDKFLRSKDGQRDCVWTIVSVFKISELSYIFVAQTEYEPCFLFSRPPPRLTARHFSESLISSIVSKLFISKTRTKSDHICIAEPIRLILFDSTKRNHSMHGSSKSASVFNTRNQLHFSTKMLKTYNIPHTKISY